MVSVVTQHKPPCFEDHEGLVHKVARGFVGQGLAYDDLVQEGCLALLSAIRTFDPDLGWQFSTHAAPLIRWRMLSSIERERKQRMTQLDSVVPNPADPHNDIASVDSRLDLQTTLDSSGLSRDERIVLKQWLGVDDAAKSFKDIGKRRGVTKQRIHQIVAAALASVESKLNKAT